MFVIITNMVVYWNCWKTIQMNFDLCGPWSKLLYSFYHVGQVIPTTDQNNRSISKYIWMYFQCIIKDFETILYFQSKAKSKGMPIVNSLCWILHQCTCLQNVIKKPINSASFYCLATWVYFLHIVLFLLRGLCSKAFILRGLLFRTQLWPSWTRLTHSHGYNSTMCSNTAFLPLPLNVGVKVIYLLVFLCVFYQFFSKTTDLNCMNFSSFEDQSIRFWIDQLLER